MHLFNSDDDGALVALMNQIYNNINKHIYIYIDKINKKIFFNILTNHDEWRMQCNNYIYLQLDLRVDLHVGEVKKLRIRGLDLQCCRALGGRDGA